MPRETDKNSALRATDPEIHELIRLETKRQDEFIRLIPSENYASAAVMEATGSILNNKYSEGYPGTPLLRGSGLHRSSRDARDRAREGPVRHGARERAAVLGVACEPSRLPRAREARRSGHGARPAVRRPPHARLGRAISRASSITSSQYDVDPETHRVDLNRVETLARASDRRSSSAAARRIRAFGTYAGFAQIAKSVGAMLVADIAHIAGLIVAGAHPHPYPHADDSHDHDAQDAARSARRHDSLRARAREAIDQRGVPGPPRRPAQPHDGGDRRRAEGGRDRRLSRRTGTRSSRTRKRWLRRSRSAASD